MLEEPGERRNVDEEQNERGFDRNPQPQKASAEESQVTHFFFFGPAGEGVANLRGDHAGMKEGGRQNIKLPFRGQPAFGERQQVYARQVKKIAVAVPEVDAEETGVTQQGLDQAQPEKRAEKEPGI